MLGTVVVTPDRYPQVLPECAALLTPAFLRGARALPLSDINGELTVALADALNAFAPAAIAAATGRKVRVEIAVPVELEAALNRLLPDESQAEADDGEAGPLEEDAERLKDLASEAPVIRLVNQIISRAVETGASDIHIEPFEDALRIRYRYDGVLQEADNPPPRMAAAIVSRIKIMARLDIAERPPAAGRPHPAGGAWGRKWISASRRSRRCTERRWCCACWTATPCSSTGRGWGWRPTVVERLGKALELPNGIVLVTGPTGSGKTTTLYTGCWR